LPDFHYKKDPFYERELKKYQVPTPSREYILEYFEAMDKPCSLKKLMRDMALTKDHTDGVTFRLKAMIRDGQIMQDREGEYLPFTSKKLIEGIIQRTKEGNGFLIPKDGSKDIFVPSKFMRSVFSKDRVLVQPMRSHRERSRREAKVVKVLERAITQLAGEFVIQNELPYLRPDTTDIDVLIPVSIPEQYSPKPNDIIVASIEFTFPNRASSPMAGTITEILGDAFTPGLEIELAIRAHNLPHVWPDDVLAEVEKIADTVLDKEKKGRADLTALELVTIDGEDSKDFDDAVYAEKTKKGFALTVAIADASHYVRPKMPLNAVAIERGNSVYFPNRVIPMLPEKLSNNLCSLRPNEDRLALVCTMQLSDKAELLNYKVEEAVIHSKARLTYTEVYQHMTGDKPLQGSFVDNIDTLSELYHILLNVRRGRGALEFDKPEPFISFDDEGKIASVELRGRNDAHRLIEEMMLLANNTIGKFVEKNQLPILWRNHAQPAEQDLEDLKKFLKLYGLTLGTHQGISPKDYAILIDKVTHREDAKLIESVILRSMKQAMYEAENLGHFGLSYDLYTHFTSPIRRYPDLYLHRVIKQFLNKDKSLNKLEQLSEKESKALYQLGDHCSMTERRADKATREAISWLKCDFMKGKVGEVFEGTITEATNFGLFVVLEPYYVEGMVHITTLPSDYYHYDNVKHSLIGKSSSRQFTLGDRIKVLIDRVDLDKRRIELSLADK
jgi:ribonuclease R